MRRQWTIAETFSASSGEFIRSASDNDVEYYHPKYRAPRQAGVRRVLPLFPCYVFVRVCDDSSVRRLDGVRKVFRLGCVEQVFIEKLRSLEDDLGYVDENRLMFWRDEPNLLPGEMVQGLFGMFAGQVGVLEGYDDKGYARVLFRILGGRELRAHVDAHELATLWELHAA